MSGRTGTQPARLEPRAKAPGLRPPRLPAGPWLSYALVLLIGVVVLFTNYAAGDFQRWDEGLYGRFARNALTFSDYLLPLDEAGRYAREPFSKPPLSFLVAALSFKLFGASLATLRLPFTLSTLALALICCAWGNDIGKRLRIGWVLGASWGIILLLTESSMRFGRYAIIENLFVMWLTLALWLQYRAATRSALWSFGAGLALSMAFLTKQLACGMVALPMFVMELARLYRRGMSKGQVLRSLGRMLSWGLPLLASMVTWAAWAYAREGETFRRMLWDFALVERFQGFNGTIHFNLLNRIAGLLHQVMQPFPWQLGAAGVAAFVLYTLTLPFRGDPRFSVRPRKLKQLPPARLASLALPVWLLVVALVLENATRSILPWYVLSFVPALCFGLAWWVATAYRAAAWRLAHGQRPSLFGTVAIAIGLTLVLFSVEASASSLVSRVNVLLLVLVVFFWVFRRRFLASPYLPTTSIACALLALLIGHSRHREYRISPGRLEVAMGAVTEMGIQRPIVSRGIARTSPKSYEPTTLFGGRVQTGKPPWRRGGASSSFDGYITTAIAPLELPLAPGVQLTRLPGGSVWGGQLDESPYSTAVVQKALTQGPLTFEAELMGSSRTTSLETDGDASGGLVRGYSPWLSESSKAHDISKATTIPLPKGQYVAAFYVKWNCNAHRVRQVAAVRVNRSSKPLRCPGRDEDTDKFRLITQRFELKKRHTVKLSVHYYRGRNQVWHDRTEIWSAATWKARAEADARPPSPRPLR